MGQVAQNGKNSPSGKMLPKWQNVAQTDLQTTWTPSSFFFPVLKALPSPSLTLSFRKVAAFFWKKKKIGL